MTIIQVYTDKKRCLPLLLLGDEQESMIDKYLSDADLFVGISDGNPIAVAAVCTVGDDSVELKNLAVLPACQKLGYGRQMLDFVCNRYRASASLLLVGTGEVPATRGFYEHCGFTYSHRIPDFFTANYHHPIYEQDILLRDMVYLKKHL